MEKLDLEKQEEEQEKGQNLEQEKKEEVKLEVIQEDKNEKEQEHVTQIEVGNDPEVRWKWRNKYRKITGSALKFRQNESKG